MVISLVVPVFNEEATIAIFYNRVRTFQPFHEYKIEILFINDGSVDTTEQLIKSLKLNDSLVRLINFTRNFGKESALMAGLEYAIGMLLFQLMLIFRTL